MKNEKKEEIQKEKKPRYPKRKQGEKSESHKKITLNHLVHFKALPDKKVKWLRGVNRIKLHRSRVLNKVLKKRHEEREKILEKKHGQRLQLLKAKGIESRELLNITAPATPDDILRVIQDFYNYQKYQQTTFGNLVEFVKNPGLGAIRYDLMISSWGAFGCVGWVELLQKSSVKIETEIRIHLVGDYFLPEDQVGYIFVEVESYLKALEGRLKEVYNYKEQRLPAEKTMKGGRPRYDANIWAYDQVHIEGKDPKIIYPEWRKKMGRKKLNKLSNPLDSFKKAIRPKKEKRD